jgi:hypothetical protein
MRRISLLPFTLACAAQLYNSARVVYTSHKQGRLEWLKARGAKAARLEQSKQSGGNRERRKNSKDWAISRKPKEENNSF